MLQHNLTIALRNLWKYRLQTAISIASIAVGIVTLAVVHSVLQLHITPPAITTMPHYDRACVLRLDSLHRNTPPAMEWQKTVYVEADVVRALTDNGGLRSIETELTGPTFGWGGYRHTYTLGDTLTRNFFAYVSSILPSYPHYAGYRSAITGQRIAPLRPGEAIISESMAKRAFGDVSPIGARTQNYKYGSKGDNTITIVDVYRDVSQFEDMPPMLMLYSVDEGVEGFGHYTISVPRLFVVLKPGCTTEQLEAEANARLEPLGLKAETKLVKEDRADDLRFIRTVRTLAYFFGSLILLAAGIGFLRMQLQLFWMRKREISLRIVHGAKRGQLFVLLMTEAGLVVLCAVVLALVCGHWLEQFLSASYTFLLEYDTLVFVDNLMLYGGIIGAVVLLVCAIIVWATLQGICRNAQGLAANMRGSRSHTFRNVMLGLQVFVGMTFMCATFAATVVCEKYADAWVMPEDDTLYRESILVRSNPAEEQQRLYAELGQLPDVAQMFPFYRHNIPFKEPNECDTAMLRVGGMRFYPSREILDTAFLEFYRVPVSWQRPELKQGLCVLINEDFYPELERTGALATGVLTNQGTPYPIAGTFRDMPFSSKSDHVSYAYFIVINPDMRYRETYVMVPVAGRYRQLWQSVNNTLAHVEPAVAEPMAFNLYDEMAVKVEMSKNLRKGAWLLGAVALLICVMGIYSTIALDTRARRKEMAIRKINGAKSWDIARIFARLYVSLLSLAVALVVPIAVLAQLYFQDKAAKEPMFDVSLALPVFAGCLTVSLTIAIIVGWHVRAIMRVNPAEIIAKE